MLVMLEDSTISTFIAWGFFSPKENVPFHLKKQVVIEMKGK
jgi:hypothetical protein